MIISTPVSAATHADNPFRVRHLIIALSQSWTHLIGDRASHDHDVRLSGRGAEDYSETILVVAGHGDLHHFYGTAGEAEA